MKHTKELIRQTILNQPRVTSEEAYRQMEEHMAVARAARKSNGSSIVFSVGRKPKEKLETAKL